VSSAYSLDKAFDRGRVVVFDAGQAGIVYSLLSSFEGSLGAQ